MNIFLQFRISYTQCILRFVISYKKKVFYNDELKYNNFFEKLFDIRNVQWRVDKKIEINNFNVI